MSNLLNAAELAALLSCHPSTVRRMTDDGLPCFWVGTSPRFDPDEVRDWLRTRRKRPGQPPAKVATVRKVGTFDAKQIRQRVYAGASSSS